MGFYIEVPENRHKARQLVELYGAKSTPQPASLAEVPEDTALICVVENWMFDAAALCYSQEEFEVFARDDGRPRQWLLMGKAKAHEISGFGGDK